VFHSCSTRDSTCASLVFHLHVFKFCSTCVQLGSTRVPHVFHSCSTRVPHVFHMRFTRVQFDSTCRPTPLVFHTCSTRVSLLFMNSDPFVFNFCFTRVQLGSIHVPLVFKFTRFQTVSPVSTRFHSAESGSLINTPHSSISLCSTLHSLGYR